MGGQQNSGPHSRSGAGINAPAIDSSDSLRLRHRRHFDENRLHSHFAVWRSTVVKQLAARCAVLALAFVATTSEAIGPSHLPPAGSPERKAVLDGVRPTIERDIGRPVKIVVRAMRVNEKYAWIYYSLVSPDGSPLSGLRASDATGAIFAEKRDGQWKWASTDGGLLAAGGTVKEMCAFGNGIAPGFSGSATPFRSVIDHQAGGERCERDRVDVCLGDCQASTCHRRGRIWDLRFA